MTSVIIPYRDRAEHLAILAPRLAQVLPDAEILVIEQAPGKPFNRAKLLNVGAKYAKGDWLVMHDVDKVPTNETKYITDSEVKVFQLCGSKFQPVGYLGGVTAFNALFFKNINGYSNNFWGWGGEDNEMVNNLKRYHEPFFTNKQPFEDLPHPRPANEFDPAKWNQAHLPRMSGDGFYGLGFEELEISRLELYTKITVEI